MDIVFKQEKISDREIMHPSKDIIGTKGDELKGRKIALCITGSVAAVRSPELARELMRHGAEVMAVMSPKATELITPQLLHWATGNEVITSLSGRIEHVEIAQWADLILVAPATANTIGKIAYAIDDTPVTSVVSVAVGLQKPVVVVPAMHESMYRHPILQENLEKLKNAKIYIIDPVVEEGKAKFPPVEKIVDFVMRLLGPKDLVGINVLITAGPTIEHIDPIKIITNRSSGKMGIAFARVAALRGADVTLVYGPGTEAPPPGIKTIKVQTTLEMKEAFENEVKKKPHVIVCAAAPQDFTVASVSQKKLRHEEETTLKLKPAPRILDNVRELAPEAFVVGFKAEWAVDDRELLEIARKKLEDHDLDVVVANDLARPGAGFGTDTSEVVIVTKAQTLPVRGTKEEIAKIIFDCFLAQRPK
ncbi:MAG: bifunctional phosphopantothenoylcysteine decarboxylase/phosphopantothenate--cysteine ligase CoaBC [Candidatus Hadarchaeales archaeon]